MRNLHIILMRGTAAQHEENPFKPTRGNFTVVLDRPELRFHDGVTPGGLVVPVPQDVYERMREFYPEINERLTA